MSQLQEKKWREQDGVIYFSVTSNGMTGQEWITYFEDKKFSMTSHAKNILRSADFNFTDGVSTEMALLRSKLFEDDDQIWTPRKISDFAAGHNLVSPCVEVACLINCFVREVFSNRDTYVMGIPFITVMHEPIKSLKEGDLPEAQVFLTVYRGFGYGDWCLGTKYNEPDLRHRHDCGLAFTVA